MVGWQKDAFLSQIVCGISKIAAHISEIDVEDYISEMIETAPSEIILDPDENYTVDMHHPATNWTFGQEDEPPTFSWSLRKCFTKELVIEKDLQG